MSNVLLVMFKSDGTRRDFPVTKGVTVIGRKVNCDLRIPLTSVSRQHCEIRLDEDKIHVKDMGSSNGTYLNSVRIQDSHLSAGDELVVGPVVFTVVVDGHPSDIKPVKTIVNGDEAIPEASSGQQALGQSDPPGSSVGAVLEEDDDDLELPELLDDDDSTPTVDLDDPVAALEALSSDSDDSDEFDDLDFFDDDDDD
ncbi:MAG: FHA domain-containing protein [Planctomycetota bacterium]